LLNAQATLTAAHADVASAQSPLLGIDVGNEEGVLNITGERHRLTGLRGKRARDPGRQRHDGEGRLKDCAAATA